MASFVVTWGCIDTAQGEFKDAIITVDGARVWDWAEHDFHHSPGYTPSFLRQLDGYDYIILTAGMHQRVECAFLVRRDPRVHFVNSRHAAAEFDRAVAEGKKVIAYVHSTC